MTEYIKKLIADMGGYPETKPAISIFALFKAVAEEVDRLDPRDFLPSAQYEFVILRMRARYFASVTSLWSSNDEPKVLQDMCRRLAKVLDQYGGKGSQSEQRDFSFIQDADLRAIVERDYKELCTRLFPSGSWKSVVILAGSILEAVLYDSLTKDAVTMATAIASPKAPKNSDLAKGEWKLVNLIEVAENLNVLPPARAKSIDQVLRDYRNFVHPKKEIKAAHPCSEAEAYMSKGALDAVCNHLTSQMK